jgi:hypothetical protein
MVQALKARAASAPSESRLLGRRSRRVTPGCHGARSSYASRCLTRKAAREYNLFVRLSRGRRQAPASGKYSRIDAWFKSGGIKLGWAVRGCRGCDQHRCHRLRPFGTTVRGPCARRGSRSAASVTRVTQRPQLKRAKTRSSTTLSAPARNRTPRKMFGIHSEPMQSSGLWVGCRPGVGPGQASCPRQRLHSPCQRPRLTESLHSRNIRTVHLQVHQGVAHGRPLRSSYLEWIAA